MRTGWIDRSWKGLKRLLPAIAEWPDRFRDDRRFPQIPATIIGQAVIEMVLRCQTSVLQLDQEGRAPEVLAWFGSARKMLVSDTTLFRVLPSFALEPLHEILAETAERLADRGWLAKRLPSGRRMRLGIVDGSCWGGMYGSVFVLAGERVDVVAGYRMCRGRGHELAASRELLDEMSRRLRRAPVELVVADGLYMTTGDLEQAASRWGCPLLIKNPSDALTVLHDARDLFDGHPTAFQTDLERVEGCDPERGVSYGGTAAAGFEWHGHRLKIARIRETILKPGPGQTAETEFWVATTDPSLSVLDMREVAHLRWRIENRTFKRLNHLVKSKRRLTHDDHTREALLGLWFVGLNLFGIVMALLRRPALPKILRTAKRTWRWIGALFRAWTARVAVLPAT